ncbi:hypothetical protein MalM25_38020 [Planctomycetes bacterium MalM25]|nr:hypothetical protein MalM25_38020 [Planctomycetes bacterium MalM25]
MSKQKPTAFQTFSRLTIMLGTLTTGSLAAWHYGPEPQDLADLIDSTASMVVEVPGHEPPTAVTAAVEFAEDAADQLSTPPAFDAPVALDTPLFDPAVQPAAATAPLAQAAPSPAPSQQALSQQALPRAVTPVLDRLERDRLTAPLLAAGAIRADVQPWGTGEQQVYRATAAFPVGDPTGGMESRLDAVETSPERAVQALLARAGQTGYQR